MKFIPFRLLSVVLLTIFQTAAGAFAADSPREKLLLDFGWKFHLGDAPDAGTNLNYPEVSDLAKTRFNEIGKEGAKDISTCLKELKGLTKLTLDL